ncbi:NAD(P)-binding protein [Thermothelomyces heterothallicus CBS 203.75]
MSVYSRHAKYCVSRPPFRLRNHYRPSAPLPRETTPERLHAGTSTSNITAATGINTIGTNRTISITKTSYFSFFRSFSAFRNQAGRDQSVSLDFNETAMSPSPSLSTTWAHFHPPKPTFTDQDVPDLTGRVCIVTGSNTGIGKEVARILYSKNARVYVAARSQDKARSAIREIKESTPSSAGSLEFLSLDLSDLSHVREAARSFLAREQRLDVLFNNAGVMVGSASEPVPRTAQGYELCLGVNCVGTMLFTELLTPVLAAAAANKSGGAGSGSVRVVWLSSFALELFAQANVGVPLDNLDYHLPKAGTERYGISKVGAWALGVEYAKRHRDDGIVSVPINPGNLTSELPRHQGVVLKTVARLVGYPPLFGAYTELWAAFSPEVTPDKSGSWGKSLHCMTPNFFSIPE